MATPGLGTDPGAFFDAFHARVYRYLSSATGLPAADLEDLAQETLLEAWRGRSGFRGESAPETWVLGIARHHALMFRRRAHRRDRRERAIAALRDAGRAELPLDVLRALETGRQVREAMASIDPAHAEVLRLRHVEGLPVRAVAERLGETEKAVESRLSRAREALRAAWTREPDDE